MGETYARREVQTRSMQLRIGMGTWTDLRNPKRGVSSCNNGRNFLGLVDFLLMFLLEAGPPALLV